MCIAVANYRNFISKKTLKNCFDNNDMGCGILYVNDEGILSTFKELNCFDNFYNAYHYIRSRTKLPMILHFRIATHGAINLENCHPFMINPNLGFVHNGIISIDTCKNYSDTYYFNELLKKLPSDFLYNTAIMELIEKSISWSKLIFMDNEGNVNIVNEQDGEYYKGNWYSNNGYEESNYINYGGTWIKKGNFIEDLKDTDDFYEDFDPNHDSLDEWERNYLKKYEDREDREDKKDDLFNLCEV